MLTQNKDYLSQAFLQLGVAIWLRPGQCHVTGSDVHTCVLFFPFLPYIVLPHGHECEPAWTMWTRTL